jgi:hypothetical protein
VRAWLVATVSAGAGLLAAGPDPLDPPPPAAAPAIAVQPRTAVALELPSRTGLHPAERPLFTTPPPLPPPRRVEFEAQPPPAPVAPPVPFTFLGTFEGEAGEVVFYLSEADKVHVVKQGEKVNGLYRVEAADAEHLELLYLPLEIRQTLLLGTDK